MGACRRVASKGQLGIRELQRDGGGVPLKDCGLGLGLGMVLGLVLVNS